MRLGRRPVAPEPVSEMAPQRQYRVAVAHGDANHPCSTPSHWGPAYDEAFAATAAHMLEVQPGEVDLLEQAEKGAARARDEYSGMDGWDVWIVRLGPDGEWERV